MARDPAGRRTQRQPIKGQWEPPPAPKGKRIWDCQDCTSWEIAHQLTVRQKLPGRSSSVRAVGANAKEHPH